MHTEDLKTILAPIFEKHAECLTAAYLFGSLAEGTQTFRSDIDIALLLNTVDKKNVAELKVAIYTDICRALKRNDIDIVILSLSGNLLLNDQIVRKGQLLYSSDEDLQKGFEVSLLHRCIDFKKQRHLSMGV